MLLLKHSGVDIRVSFKNLDFRAHSTGKSLHYSLKKDMWIRQRKLITVYVPTFVTISIEKSELYPQNAHIVLLAYSIDGRCAYNFSRGFLR